MKTAPLSKRSPPNALVRGVHTKAVILTWTMTGAQKILFLAILSGLQQDVAGWKRESYIIYMGLNPLARNGANDSEGCGRVWS